MITIEEFISLTNAASSPEEVFLLFQRSLKQMGFNRVVYSLITDHPSMNKKAGHGLQFNYPEDWMKYYAENQYETKDPVPQYAFVTDKPFTWNWLINSKDLSPIEKKVMNEATEAKLLDGVGIPIYGANGEIAGVGLASSTGGIDPDKDMLCKLRALSLQFHLAYSELEAKEENAKDIFLTDKEREVLLWTAEGKTTHDMAMIMGISENTVKWHLKNIYQKLGANEKTYAVVKALRLGLIVPSFVKPHPIG